LRKYLIRQGKAPPSLKFSLEKYTWYNRGNFRFQRKIQVAVSALSCSFLCDEGLHQLMRLKVLRPLYLKNGGGMQLMFLKIAYKIKEKLFFISIFLG